jgi:hypothetical protein
MKKTTAFLLAATGFTALVAALVISVAPGQQTRLYSEPGASAVTLEVYRDTVGGVGSADISIFGYLVDISQS